jgi:hypothetical protein
MILQTPGMDENMVGNIITTLPCLKSKSFNRSCRRVRDIDAIHFDDYFYPYKIPGENFNDTASSKIWWRNEFSRLETFERE